jgi:hypothetical protein
VRATEIGAGDEDIEVSATVGGLDPSQTYHFRAVAKNSAGTVHGADEVLLTAPSHWTPRSLPQPPNSGNGHEALGVSCVHVDSCVAVGENWSLAVHTRTTLAETWDGDTWTVMETANPPGLDEGWQHDWYATLSGVSCTSTGFCLAVGRFRDPSESVKPLAERWDGSEWTIVPVPIPSGAVSARLEGVSCTSS